MDSLTFAFYDSQAQMLADRYEGVPSPVEAYFPMAFAAGARVLDIGCGSGRDTARLLAHGYNAFGIEPAAGLRDAAAAAHPELTARLLAGALPDQIDGFGGDFDGVVCSAVLMHVPDTELLDAALSIRAILKPQGRLLLSLPASRPDTGIEHRDIHGRLFAPYTAEQICLLFERLGFQLIHRWDNDDSFGRGGIRWFTLLLARRDTGSQRPIDQIETILNRDRKEATYKLALLRALAEVATQQARTAVWCANGEVGVPIQRIAELWLQYYWPLLASDRFIPQSKAEAAGGKPVKFRSSLEALIRQFAGQGIHGGLTSWHLAWLSQKLEPGLVSQLRVVLRLIAETIRDGPVTYSGGALETGPVFRFDSTTKLILMSAELWRELSLLGHWIGDAVIVRWAALTEKFAHRQGLTVGDVLPLLLARPEALRATTLARQVFQAAGMSRCTWSNKGLKPDFAVDHIIAFSLWGNNDLWNLVPADPKTNLSKSDKLPAKLLLLDRRAGLFESWEVLRSDSPHAFDRHAHHLMGTPLAASGDWQPALFSRLKEAVELTALQRGVERWVPG
jgi:SAM-dependent methyltransferase